MSMVRIRLTPAAREKIAAAVRAAESGTSGEIVPVVTPASDRYAEAQWACAAFLAFIGLFIDLEFFAVHSVLEPMVVTTLAFCLGWGIGAIPPVKRFVTGRRNLQREVEERALQAFYSRQIDRTAKSTGMLIFLSLLEHRVVILADKGIDEKVPSGTWDSMVQALIVEIRAGRWSEGLAHTIEACGAVLKKHFPAAAGDHNELPDDLIEEHN